MQTYFQGLNCTDKEISLEISLHQNLKMALPIELTGTHNIQPLEILPLEISKKKKSILIQPLETLPIELTGTHNI